MSSLGWIDFSSDHRDKVRTVIDLLSSPGMLDELGIGVIRDGFSNRMFPGLSTVQTRAKYLSLTAFLIREYQTEELLKAKPRSLTAYFDEREKWCRIQLVKSHGELSSGRLGIIGGTFGTDSKRDVVRKPSSIYWGGLRDFGIVKPRSLSLVEFGARLQGGQKQLQALLSGTGSEKGDDPDAGDQSQMARVIAPEIDPETYWENLSIDLLNEEAVFLRNQICSHQPDSLIGHVLLADDAMVQVMQFNGDSFAQFTELPFIDRLKNTQLGLTIEHARDFWQLLKGAHIRYNCLVQQKLGTADLLAEFEEQWEDWRNEIRTFPARWDSSFMWRIIDQYGGNVKSSTKQFINRWIEQCENGAGDVVTCDRLVTHQERRNKRERARLREGNDEPVNRPLGFSAMNYRLEVARTLVHDIWEGENQNA